MQRGRCVVAPARAALRAATAARLASPEASRPFMTISHPLPRPGHVSSAIHARLDHSTAPVMRGSNRSIC